MRDLELANRIVVSPMCQYSADQGCATDWHLMHLGQLAVAGPGLVIFEMTGIEPRARITPRCLGLWSDANETALARVIAFCRRHGAAKIGIQIAHAGRKASCRPPWEGGSALPLAQGGWETVGPSPIAAGPDLPAPRALAADEIEGLIESFAASARRAARIGFDLAELHSAHGYLLHQFLSPLSNRREDRWGGDRERRMRFPLAVFDAVRAAWPANRPLGVRVSACDWIDGGWTADDTVAYARALAQRGCDFMDVSSGGLDLARQRIPAQPGFQVPFAERVRREAQLPTMAVGLISEPFQAQAIIDEERADLVALARGLLDDPHWCWHAARALGAEATYPAQYLRCRPDVWRPVAPK